MSFQYVSLFNPHQFCSIHARALYLGFNLLLDLRNLVEVLPNSGYFPSFAEKGGNVSAESAPSYGRYNYYYIDTNICPIQCNTLV